jgi:hypothetical protein
MCFPIRWFVSCVRSMWEEEGCSLKLYTSVGLKKMTCFLRSILPQFSLLYVLSVHVNDSINLLKVKQGHSDLLCFGCKAPAGKYENPILDSIRFPALPRSIPVATTSTSRLSSCSSWWLADLAEEPVFGDFDVHQGARVLIYSHLLKHFKQFSRTKSWWERW